MVQHGGLVYQNFSGWVIEMYIMLYLLIFLVNQVNWDDERICFQTIAAAIATFYAFHPPLLPNPSGEGLQFYRRASSGDPEEGNTSQTAGKSVVPWISWNIIVVIACWNAYYIGFSLLGFVTALNYAYQIKLHWLFHKFVSLYFLHVSDISKLQSLAVIIIQTWRKMNSSKIYFRRPKVLGRSGNGQFSMFCSPPWGFFLSLLRQWLQTEHLSR